MSFAEVISHINWFKQSKFISQINQKWLWLGLVDKSGDTCHSVMDYTLCADDVAHTNMFTANLLSFATLYDDVGKEIEGKTFLD